RQRSNLFGHMSAQLRIQLRRREVRSLQRYKRNYRRSFQIIRPRNHSSFGDSFVRYQRTLNLGGPEPVTADVYDIVDAAHDPKIAIFITPCAVSCEVDIFDL